MSDRDDQHQQEEARPEALLAALWSEIRSRRDRGETPELVVLSMENYRKIQRYHAELGTLPNADLDYISRYELFGLPIYVDDAVELEVRCVRGRRT
jgi:hypothetical protein